MIEKLKFWKREKKTPEEKTSTKITKELIDDLSKKGPDTPEGIIMWFDTYNNQEKLKSINNSNLLEIINFFSLKGYKPAESTKEIKLDKDLTQQFIECILVVLTLPEKEKMTDRINTTIRRYYQGKEMFDEIKNKNEVDEIKNNL